MACIVYQTNKKTGVIYAFRSESYRDPVTKKPKSHRTYLGRVDPETKKIIPKAEPGKHNRTPVGAPNLDEEVLPVEVSTLLAQQRQEIRELNAQIEALNKRSEENEAILEQICDLLNQVLKK